jgi:hypothetical protein
MALIDSIIAFVVSLLIGALGIYIGARVIVNTEDYTYAIVTALIGAIVWVIVAALVGWIPLLGPILALIAWIAVVNWRYPGGWVDATLIGLIAWVASLVVLWILGTLGFVAFDALGVPAA